ncbi:MAG: hypothetical protein QNK89_04585, partial [Lacinutrix sp.]|uniref:hypothetical protein n=1 Tax=Lacinutrix sp. TaxID=1937692 RepID=UPI0030B0B572
MANLKISDLPVAGALQGEEIFAVVQEGVTKKTTLNVIDNYLVPTGWTNQANITIDLGIGYFDNVMLLVLSWGGVNGTQVLKLPSASSSTNRIIRIITNGNYAVATRTELTAVGGDTLDGST